MASAPPVQLQIENDTTQRRRVFALGIEMPVGEPVPLALAAWKSFDMEPAGTSWAAYPSTVQLAARVLSDAGNHQTVLAEAELGDKAVFSLGEEPMLKVGRGEFRQQVALENKSSAAIEASLLRDFGPLATVPLASGQTAAFEPEPELFFYASTAIAGNDQPLVLEPVVGKLDLASPGGIVEVKLFPDGAGIRWIFR